MRYKWVGTCTPCASDLAHIWNLYAKACYSVWYLYDDRADVSAIGCSRRRAAPYVLGGATMDGLMDTLVLTLGIVLFAISIAYVTVCERL
jgi:hypothetical protein